SPARYVDVMAGGRHRTRPRGGPRTRMAVYAAAAVLAVTALVVAIRSGGQVPCVGELRLTLAVASEIAPAIRDTASEWAASARAPDNQCVAVDVRPIEPADVAVAITGAAGVTLPGLSSESGSTLVPDVWVPDATSWLHRVRAVGQSLVPDEAESIARSPIVIAMPEPVASTLGWPSERLSWTALLEQVRNNQSMNLGIVEPSR